MPTTKPRLTVVLDPDDMAAIAELSELNGESLSSIVAGIVHEVAPTLRRINAAARAVLEMEQDARQKWAEGFERYAAEVTPRLEEMHADLSAQLGSVPRLDPRPVTRGSGDPDVVPLSSEQQAG